MNPGLNLLRRTLLLAVLLVANESSAAEQRPTSRNWLPAPPTPAASVAANMAATDAGSPKPANAATAADVPPSPPGVTELKFSEFFRQPIGSRGLEFTEKIRGLDGKRVRVLG